jgi:hypothetical protein
VPIFRLDVPGAVWRFSFPQGAFRRGFLTTIALDPGPLEALRPPIAELTVLVRKPFPGFAQTLRDRPGLLFGEEGPSLRSLVGCAGSAGSEAGSGTAVPGDWRRFLNRPSGYRSQVWAHQRLLIGLGTVSCVLGVLDASSPVCCVAESLTASAPASEWGFAHGNWANSKVNELLGPGVMASSGKLVGISGK